MSKPGSVEKIRACCQAGHGKPNRKPRFQDDIGPEMCRKTGKVTTVNREKVPGENRPVGLRGSHHGYDGKAQHTDENPQQDAEENGLDADFFDDVYGQVGADQKEGDGKAGFGDSQDVFHQ